MTKRKIGNRFLAFILTIAVVFTSAVQGVGFGNSAQAASVYTKENLTKHSTFEETDVTLPTGGIAVERDNWHTYLNSAKTNEQAHTGSWSVKLPQTYSSLEQDVPNLQVGTTYIFSAWAKVNVVAAGASARIGAKNYGGSQVMLEVKSVEWKQYSLEFTYTGTQDARCYAYIDNAAGGTVLYVDDMSLTVKSDVDRAEVQNGEIRVDFGEAYTGTPSANDFEANYSSSTASGVVKELPLTQQFSDAKALEMSFAPIEAQPVEQTIFVNLTHKVSKQTITLDFVIPASGGAVIEGKLVSLQAENGSAVATLEEAPTVSPTAADFSWIYSVDGGEYKTLDVSNFVYDASAKTVTVSFSRLASLPSGAQEITVKAIYNETEATDSFTIEQGESEIYYVDATNGLDTNNGTTPETAFRSIDKLNTITFQPGDQILFKKGETFVGGFQPKGSGVEGYPITVASYGDEEAARPVIKPGAAWQIPYLMSADTTIRNPMVNHAIKFYNQEYWEVSDLELYDPSYAENGASTNVYRSGICVSAENIGELEHFYFDNLVVHGFRGPGSNIGKTSGGIVMNVYRNPDLGVEKQLTTSINDIRITNCEIYNVGRSGINFLTPWARRAATSDTKWGPVSYGNSAYLFNPYKNFYLGNNIIHDVDGDGLIVDNNDEAMVENNLVYRTCLRPGSFGASVGMFNWNSDDTTFQYNEVYDIQTAGDAQGIEVDALNDRTWVQYNYLHDNAGGLMMWCNTGNDIRGFDAIIRYNISQNDGVGHGLFDIRPYNYGSEFYNNTVYLKPDVLDENGKIKLMGYASCVSTMKFYNNIFYYSGETAKPVNNFGDGIIDWRSNIFHNITNLPVNDDPGAPNVNVDPLFVDPGKGVTGTYAGEKVDLSGYALQDGSPAIDAGVPMANNGGKDYFGNPVSGIPDIGAYDSGSASMAIKSTEFAINQAEKKINLNKKDKTTVAQLLAGLIHEDGVTLSVYRGAGVIVGSTRLSDGDVVKISKGDEEDSYTIAVNSDSSSVGEIPVEVITATAGNSQSGEGPENVLDGNTGSVWHTKWGGSPRAEHYITFEMENPYMVDGLRYLQRQSGGTNGIITRYRIDVSMDGTNWTEGVATGTWVNNPAWKTVTFTPVKAKYVKLVSLESISQEAGKDYTSAAEIRLDGTRVYEDAQAPTAPLNVEATDVTQTTATIRWNASTDNVGVAGYTLKNGETEIATMGSDLLTYTVTGLEANQEYTFTVVAFDEAGNVSPAGSVTFTTKGAAPTIVDKSTLKLVLDLADVHVKNGDVDKLIPAAKEKFNAVLKNAQDVYASEIATEAQVDKAWKDLMLAIQGLGFVPGDKTALAALFAAADVLDLDLYEDGAEKNAFTAALTKAEEVLSDANALPSDVKDAHDKLDAAIKALKPKPVSGDKTLLGTVIEVAESYDLTKYVDDANKTNFEKVLADAKDLYDNNDKATQGEIDQMRVDLLNAMEKLRLRADKSHLNDWLEALKGIDTSKLSAEDAAAVRAMIAEGEAMAAQDLGIDEAKLIEAMTARMEALYTSIQPSEPDPDESSKPDSKPEEGSSSATPDKPDSGSSSTGSGSKTGDTAPIAAVSLLAVAAAGAWLLLKKRKN